MLRAITAALLTVTGFLTGCSTMQPQSNAAFGAPGILPAAEAYKAPGGSLFPADQSVLNNAQIGEIFATRVYPPAHGRIAVLRMGERNPYWWISREVAALDQQTTDALLKKLRSSARVTDVLPVPSLLMPAVMTVPYLRESAARVQADSLLVYRTYTQTYQTPRWFAPDEVKAHCTVEALLLDVRTGIVTTTAVATRDFALSQKSDTANEAMARAEQTAAADALANVGDALVAFLNAANLPAVPPTTQPVTRAE